MKSQYNDEESVFHNHRLLLLHRPKGMPQTQDFGWDTQVISQLPPQPLGIIVQTLYISIAPAMRGWMSAAPSYLPPVKLGCVMRASTIGRIVASNQPSKFPVGSIVRCEDGGVQTYSVIPKEMTKFVSLLDVSVLSSSQNNNNLISLSSFLGVLGTTGLTAYFGLLRVGKPNAGDTVLVSGAAGATGSVVCQIAKQILGCKVIGTAGSPEKCKWLEEHGIVDVAINYKLTANSVKGYSKAIRDACSGGVNVVFDNVGGTFLEAALGNLARGARIVLCGAISQYNADSSTTTVTGPRNYMNLLVRRASMTGFVVFDYRKEYSLAIRDLSCWIQNGQLQHKEDITEGIINFYPALMSLFQGTNQGKVLIRIKEELSMPRRSKF
mmetsp:Transcript_1184/g.1510  ORF Transcript_1184/g.1510 Transcript_1184/m.1510 type:complete len:381 (+) Transcript_1184:105-1247(+)